MYEHLLRADVVVADLSTSNPNAIYEIGVRHALRPHTTIVIAESGFNFPFDIHSLLVRTYEHMGKGINYAFMLDVRAARSTGDDAIADRVFAQRVRRRVITVCETMLDAGIKDDEGGIDPHETFWMQATLVEALMGTGKTACG